MKLCSRCNKNIAMIYMNKMENGKESVEHLCIKCAKELGVPGIDNLLKQTGMEEEELNHMMEHMNDMFEGMDPDQMNLSDLMGMMDGMDGLNGMNDFESYDEEEGYEELDDPENALDEDMDEGSEAQSGDSESVKQKKKRKKRFGKKKHLDTYGSNLTEKAKIGEIDRIIGRQREIDRMVQILNRRSKNNPVLIGEPGVGKTAIAEGLALRIAEQQVPAKLFGAEVYLLDMTAIVAGTQFRGQFEGRIKAIVDEAKERGNVILVIDELHNIVGAGDLQGGAMNAANILKPALARGAVQIIGATTLEEYRKHIEKDAALERRFQPIIVDEPTPEESVEILKGIRSYYEDYHKVNVFDQVVEACVRLSDRYIRDRYLPDKAIDVMDEAGSRANLKNKGLVELAALKEDLDKVRAEKLQAAELEDYERSADLKMEEITLEEKISKLEEAATHVEIGIEDIAYVIEAWTKIPVQKITEDEADRLLILEDRLKRRVIGQNEAVESLAKAVRRNRSGFRKLKKPTSFIFVGPTGVGKTELAKSLSTELFGSDDNMIRLDMSEYMERHTVSKLIGAPPGYVGFDQGGKLTDIVRRNPYSVILLDEIEKAHPDIFNILLQILDDGRLTDSQGRTVYFDNAVIIMTSNLGTSSGAARIGFGSDSHSAVKEKVREALRSTFRPEFLNRVDDIITFNKLKHKEFESILELMLKEVKVELHDKQMTMEVDQEAKTFLIEKGYSEEYGARPMRRAIQTYLEDEIAEAYLRSQIKDGDHLRISVSGDHLKVLPKSRSVEEIIQ